MPIGVWGCLIDAPVSVWCSLGAGGQRRGLVTFRCGRAWPRRPPLLDQRHRRPQRPCPPGRGSDAADPTEELHQLQTNPPALVNHPRSDRHPNPVRPLTNYMQITLDNRDRSGASAHALRAPLSQRRRLCGRRAVVIHSGGAARVGTSAARSPPRVSPRPACDPPFPLCGRPRSRPEGARPRCI